MTQLHPTTHVSVAARLSETSGTEQALAQPRSSPQTLSDNREPDLVMLLDDPEVRLVMRADNVNERELLTLLEKVRVQLRKNAEPAQSPDATMRAYRPGVGIVLVNAHGSIFVGRRADLARDAWQLPQGGVEDGETPRQAALRELKEETGTDNAEIIAESSGWFYYEVPQKLARKAWGCRWEGQRQKWFVMLFKGTDSEINLAGAHPEFDAWRWVPVQELTELAVSFKHKLYLDVIGEFATVFRD